MVLELKYVISFRQTAFSSLNSGLVISIMFIAFLHFIDPLNISLLVSFVVILLVIVFFIVFKRITRIEVETISPGDLFSDETTREIILIVGDAGEKGIKQSELVKVTGKPKSTISRRIKRLSEEGFVEIIRAGKYNIIVLTGRGREVYEQLRSERMKNE